MIFFVKCLPDDYKIGSNAGLCNSSPFFLESPFRTIRQIFQPEIEMDAFDEMFEMSERFGRRRSPSAIGGQGASSALSSFLCNKVIVHRQLNNL